MPAHGRNGHFIAHGPGEHQHAGGSIANVGDNNRRTPHSSRACDECHRKKSKCDGIEPTCGPCVATNFPCAWTGRDQRRLGASRLNTDVAELQSRVGALEGKVQALIRQLGPSFPSLLSLLGSVDAAASPITPLSSAPPSPSLGPVEVGPDTATSMGGGLLTVPLHHEHARRHYRNLTGVSTDSSELDYQCEPPSGPFYSAIPAVVVEQRNMLGDAMSPMTELGHIFSGLGGFEMDGQPAVLPAPGIARTSDYSGGNGLPVDGRSGASEVANIAQTHPGAYSPDSGETATWLVLVERNTMSD